MDSPSTQGCDGQPDVLELKCFHVGQEFFDNQVVVLSPAGSNVPVYFALVDLVMLMQSDVVQAFN